MRRAVLLMLVLAVLLAGCGPRSYVSISPHLDIGTSDVDDDALTASNYSELRSAIMHLVEQRIEEGTVSLVGYSGLAEQDVRTACSEVTNDEPLGAYGVEYMSYSCVKVLANYEAAISITYSRSQEEFDAVRQVSGAGEFRTLLGEALTAFDESLAVELSYYSAADFDVAAMIDERLRSDPLGAVTVPECEIDLYPSSGLRRILEVKLKYPVSADLLASRRAELVAEAAGVAARAPVADTSEVIRAIVDEMTLRSTFLADREDDLTGEVSRDSTFTAYGALVGGAATSEGYALALSGICTMLGIESRTVEGRWNGISHHWNLVETDEGWFHVDAALCDYYGDDRFLLRTDAEIEDELKWNAQGLPATAEIPLGMEIEPTPIEAPPAEPTEG